MLDIKTVKEIRAGIKAWKKALRGCLKFVKLDHNQTRERKISREKFGGENVPHVLFTKIDNT